MSTTRKSKILSLVLAFVMVLTLLPITAPLTARAAHYDIVISDSGEITATIVDAALDAVGVQRDDYDSEDTYTVSFTGNPTKIGDDAFEDCFGLTEITIPASVTSIGDDAFFDCYSLTEITFAALSSLETIGADAFAWCFGLTAITIPASVTEIGEEVFYYCYNLIEITFAAASELETIDNYAFSACNSLAAITIPASVTEIGEGAFAWCYDLTAVCFEGNVPTFGASVFGSCDPLLTVYYTEAYKGAWEAWANDDDYYIAHISTMPASGDCLITGFTITGQAGETLIIGNAIYVTMPEGTMRDPDTWDFIGLFTPTIIHNGSGISPASGEEVDFEYSVMYTVTNNAGKIRRYMVYVNEDWPIFGEITPSGSNVPTSTNKLTITFADNIYMDEDHWFGDVSINNGATLSDPTWSWNEDYPYNSVLTYTLGNLKGGTTYTVTISGYIHGGGGLEMVSLASWWEPYMSFFKIHTFATAGGGETSAWNVYYNANGGKGARTVTGLVGGSKHTILTLGNTGISREDYTFTGWNTAANGGGTAYAPGDEITIRDDVVLYAQWEENKDSGEGTYTVVYEPNGGTGSQYSVTEDVGSAHIVLANSLGYKRSGYVFRGWSTSASAASASYFGTGSESIGAGAEAGDTITLYAVWSKLYFPGDPELTIDDEEIPLGFLDMSNHFAYIIGYPDGTVQPEGNITRAEVAAIFFRLLTQESRAEIWNTSNSFPDVNSADWYNNSISTLVNGNILKGYSDGTFRPDASITRAEFAVIAAKFAKAEDAADVTGMAAFNDISGYWAENYIALAGALGYIQGYGDGSFRPDEPITRAEVATLLNNVLNRHVNAEDDLPTGMIAWPDNVSGEWYYLAIQEATNSHFYERNEDGINEIWTELRAVPDWKALNIPTAKPEDVVY